MAKLLIIEDDPFAQRMYQRLFAHQNHEVIIAGNGKEGFELAVRRLPDLILVDILLPGISGLELLEKLKIEQSTKAIPVFVISNLAGEDVVADAKRLG
ncbi:MAG TPA: response regulator, partial [Patescibacteria group bacterium]|nr:response regulator [Patescibacteria group bacterium]